MVEGWNDQVNYLIICLHSIQLPSQRLKTRMINFCQQFFLPFSKFQMQRFPEKALGKNK